MTREDHSVLPEREGNMKSLRTLIIAGLMVFSLSALGFAQSSAVGNETYGSSGGTGIGGNDMNTYGQYNDLNM